MKYGRIRDLREDRDLTQKQMAEVLNCSQRIYSNYERGDVDIPTEIPAQAGGVPPYQRGLSAGPDGRNGALSPAEGVTICENSRLHFPKSGGIMALTCIVRRIL